MAQDQQATATYDGFEPGIAGTRLHFWFWTSVWCTRLYLALFAVWGMGMQILALAVSGYAPELYAQRLVIIDALTYVTYAWLFVAPIMAMGSAYVYGAVFKAEFLRRNPGASSDDLKLAREQGGEAWVRKSFGETLYRLMTAKRCQ